MSETSWQPTSFDEFVGQKDLIQLLRDEADAAFAEYRPMVNLLMYGGGGLGKTAIAELVAAVLNVPCHTFVGPAVTIETISKMMSQLDASGYDKDGYLVDRKSATFPIVVLDECEEVPRSVYESIHRSLEPVGGRASITAKLPGRKQAFNAFVPHVSWVCCTNYFGKLKKVAGPAVTRFPIQWNFQPYQMDEIETILHQYAEKTDQPVEEEAIVAIAKRSMGVPRHAIAQFRQARTRVVAMIQRGELEPHKTTITAEIASGSAKLLKIDDNGLPPQHLRYLQLIAKSGGKVSLPSLAAGLCMDEETIRVDIEPDLIRKSLVGVVAGGRELTEEGLEYVGGGGQTTMLGKRS